MTKRHRIYLSISCKRYLYLAGVELLFIFSFLIFPLSGFSENQIPVGDKTQSPDLQAALIIDRMTARSEQNILNSKKDSALYYADMALEAAGKINYTHGLAMAYSRKSQIAKHFDDDIPLSKKYSEEALYYFEKTADKTGIDSVYYYLFWAAVSECDFEKAMDYNEKYYTEARQKNDGDGIYLSLTGMFELNKQMGNYEKSFLYAQQLYDIAVKRENKIWIVNSLWNLAELYTLEEAYPEALNYYRRVREMSDQEVISDRLSADKEIWFQMEFAETFSRMRQFDSAWHYYQSYKPTNNALKAVYWVSIGEYYFLQGDFYQALENVRLGLAEHRKHHDVNDIMRSLLDIARIYLSLDSLSQAIRYGREGLDMALHTRVNQNIRDGFKILSQTYDRLGKTDSSNYYFRKYTIVKDVVLNDQAKGKFAAYNYEQRIEMMKKEKQIQEIQLQKQTLLKNILIGSILFLIVLAVIVFRNAMLSRKYEARRRELAENELRIQKLESEKSRAELLQQTSELEMKALRAQMNPHFIFNCLNSINLFIIRNDAGKAADYLTKFAKLIRMVLEKSGKPFILLEEELNCLQLYMDLEAIRFENPFTYEINLHLIDSTLVMIPSLLIQPFVENAIWHGLYPNEDHAGKITINMNLENDILHCKISDNGIGMEKSAALKGNNKGKKKSFGIEVTRQRLQLADPMHSEVFGVSFEDLRNGAGENAGTCVCIDIPVKFI